MVLYGKYGKNIKELAPELQVFAGGKGGMLQHGALVAREYGKPCVSGIEDAVSVLKDGQM